MGRSATIDAQPNRLKLPTTPIKQQVEGRAVWNDGRSPDAAQFFNSRVFGDKVDKLRGLINVHATKADLGTSLLIKALNNVLNRAKQSAEKRNHLVHGLVRFDRERRCFISQLKGKEITLRTNALNELAESMLRLMTDLIFLSLKLVDALAPAYDKRGIGGPFAPNG
jgi:hypothetical protein